MEGRNPWSTVECCYQHRQDRVSSAGMFAWLSEDSTGLMEYMSATAC